MFFSSEPGGDRVAGYGEYLAKISAEIGEARAEGATKINQAKAVFVFPDARAYFRGRAGKTEADINCSVCTAAAVARKRTGSASWHTGTVNAQLGERGDEAFIKWRRKTEGGLHTALPIDVNKSNRDLQDQVDGLAEWCTRTLGVLRRNIIGNALSPVSSSFALAWMKSQDDGALFAVYVYVPLFTAYDPVAHWIYAEKAGGNLKFIDYQTDRAEVKGSGPTQSHEPMKPGGGSMGGKYQMIVVAFLPDQAPKPLTGGRLI